MLLIVGNIYRQGLNGDLVIDDLPNLQPLGDLATGAIGWRDVVLGNDSGPLGRPLAMASLVADFKLGDGAVYQFKRTNLLLHLLCGVLLYLVAFRLYANSGKFNIAAARWWALAVTSIWCLTPLFASTVLYVIQRMAQLSTLFSMLGLLLYLIARSWLVEDRGGARVLMIGAYVLVWPAAILSKENGVLLSTIIFVVELLWFKFEANSRQRRFLIGVHFCFFAVPAIVAGVWLLTHLDRISAGYAGRDFTLAQRLLTESRALWDYVFQLLVPDGLRMGVVQDDYPVSRGLLDPPATLIALCAWGLVAVLLSIHRHRSEVGMLSFGLAFFMAGHLLESTVLPLELYFEHRNYLPAMGLLIGIVGGLAMVAERTRKTWAFATIIVTSLVLYGFVTYQRVMVWQSAEAIARMAETSHPRSPRLQTALISLYTRDGNLEKAMAHLDRLVELTGGRTIGHALNEIMIYCTIKHVPSSAEYAAIKATNRIGTSVYEREQVAAFAEALRRNDCQGVDLNEFRGWLLEVSVAIKGSRDWMMAFQMARVFEMLGNPNEAMNLLDVADRIDPRRLEPRLIKIRLMIAAGALEPARELLFEVEKDLPNAVNYQREMIESYRERLVAPRHEESQGK